MSKQASADDSYVVLKALGPKRELCYYSLVAPGGAPHSIASVWIHDDGGPEESERIAHLLSAAPDLLKCLRKFVLDIANNEDFNSQAMLLKAEAAIAKAEGRP